MAAAIVEKSFFFDRKKASKWWQRADAWHFSCPSHASEAWEQGKKKAKKVTPKGLQRMSCGPCDAATTALSGKMQERVELEAAKADLQVIFEYIKSDKSSSRDAYKSRDLRTNDVTVIYCI